jgi:hypothetical protein
MAAFGGRDTTHDGRTAVLVMLAAPFWGRVAAFELEEGRMLWTIFVILLVLWLLGVVTSYTLGGFTHVLLVVAVIIAIMQLLQGRRAL